MITCGCGIPTICCFWEHKDISESAALDHSLGSSHPQMSISCIRSQLIFGLPRVKAARTFPQRTPVSSKTPQNTSTPPVLTDSSFIPHISAMLSGMSEHGLCKFSFDLKALKTPVYVYMTYEHLTGTWEEDEKWYTHIRAYVCVQAAVGGWTGSVFFTQTWQLHHNAEEKKAGTYHCAPVLLLLWKHLRQWHSTKISGN